MNILMILFTLIGGITLSAQSSINGTLNWWDYIKCAIVD